jgi:putative alpha-1,2-mannosidase
MVKLGPDLVLDQTNAYAGYLPDGEFTGFSMMHLSGTGGVPMYGVMSQLPILGQITNPLDLKVGRAVPDIAEVGYYGARTSDDIFVELAATEHAAMYQYTFPEDQSSIVVDLSHRLPSFRGFDLEQRFEGGDVTIDLDGQYQGSATYSNGYNMAPPWKIYFCTFRGDLLHYNLLTTLQVGSLISLQFGAESSKARPIQAMI